MSNCVALLAGDETELSRANRTMSTQPKVPIYEETYLEWTQDCTKFRKDRGYVEVSDLIFVCNSTAY